MIELWQAALPVIEAFELLEIEYAITGSVASSYTGVARATQDADLVAALHLAQAEPLLGALGSAYYADLDRARQAIRSQRSFNVIHLPTMFKVDLFAAQQTPFARSSFARRVQLEVAEIDRRLWFMAAEDLVLHKLLWYSAGGAISDRQWYDLAGVLRIQGATLDRSYLKSWAGPLGVAELLARAFSEAGLDPP